MKTIYVDFNNLSNVPESFKNDFTGKIMETIRQKYEGTNVFITDNPNAAEIAHESGSLKSIVVHNNQILDDSDDALGTSFTEEEVAEIDLQDFLDKGYGTTSEVLGEQVGTVAAHEGFHLLGPGGHSMMDNNLMSEGGLISDKLKESGGTELEFTDLQKSILNNDNNIGSSMTISEIEESYHEWLEEIVDANNLEDIFVDFLDSLV